MTVTLTSIQGIPAVLAPRSDGVIAGGLVFRVGMADETLPLRGVTHLVEHLALFQFAGTALHHNGATSQLATHFYAEGTTDEVVQFLNRVCRGLSAPPLDRLDPEKEILRTEGSGRSGASLSPLIYRYGAATYGLAAYPEIGFNSLDAAGVQDWVCRYFTRGNVALWLTTAELPEGLELELPDGPRRQPPTATDALPLTPAWYADPACDVVHVNGLLPRSSASVVFTHLLDKAAYADLRIRDALSYRAGAAYEPRGATTATVSVLADCLPDKQEAVAEGVIDLLDRLKEGEFSDEQAAAAKRSTTEAVTAPDAAAQALPSQAVDLLLQVPLLDPAEYLSEVAEVTRDDLTACAEQFRSSALAQLPGALDHAGWVPAPMFSDSAVTGRSIPSDDRRHVLIIGEDGITQVSAGNPLTVRFADIAAVQHFADGGRTFIGLDGFRVAVEPTLYPLAEATLSQLDSRVPAHLVVQQERSEGAIPQPGPRLQNPKKAKAKQVGGGVVSAIVYAWFTVMGAGLASALTWGMVRSPSNGLALLIVLTLLVWGFAIWSAYMTVQMIRIRVLGKPPPKKRRRLR